LTTEKNYKEEFHKHGITDIQLLIKDVFNNYIIREDEYALVHIDLTKKVKLKESKFGCRVLR